MKILLVEDEFAHQHAFNEALADLGHKPTPTIVWVKHSDDAVAHISSGNIDVAFIDIRLKGSRLNGIELITHLRQDMKTDLPIVCYSISRNEKDKQMAYEAGCNLYIPKPYEFDYLFSILSYVINAVSKGEPLEE